MNKSNWTEDFMTISSVVVPMLLISFSVFTPRSLVNEDQKDALMIAGLTALVNGGARTFGKKTEIRQEVQTQEMNLSPSVDIADYRSQPQPQPQPQQQRSPYSNADFVEYNPPQHHQSSYLSEVPPSEEEYLNSREPVASSPYKIASPDDDA